MWKFIVDVVHDFASSLQPDVGRGFLHVSNVFLFYCVAAGNTAFVEVPVGLGVVVCVCVHGGGVCVCVCVWGGGGGGGGGAGGIPSHNSPILEPTISKFGPIMHLNPNLIYV